MKLFNSGKMKLNNMDDLILFYGLLHNKIIWFKILNVNIWRDINRIMNKHQDDINGNSLPILISIMITHFETNRDISAIESGLISLL